MERARDPPVEGYHEGCERTDLSAALGTTAVALVRYRLPRGGELPGGLHAHADQAEVYLVRDGRLTVETLDGRTELAADEAVRFAPGEVHRGLNDGSDPAVVLALGAPRETEDTRVPADCPACGHAELRVVDGPAFRCPSCDTERRPAPCPDCGRRAMRMVLGPDGPVAGCRDCGLRVDRPPFER